MMQLHAEAGRDDDEPELSIGDVRELVFNTDQNSDNALVGERFGKYLIVGELATGGMAEVFLAVHKGLEDFLKVVVIKRVLPQFNTNEEFVRMFVDEARLAARLDHPNIVRTYEFGEVAGQYFTTMEYLPGEDLGRALRRLVSTQQKIPVQLAASIVGQVCAGLYFAHQLTDTAGRPLNLVHRDVNPANIIVTYGGEVKLIDFGVAKTSSNAQTVAGTIKGKLSYMAPEQLLGRGVDQRSDVFSAGVVLWELLTLRPLFMRDNEAATLYAIMNDPISPPSRYRPEVPPELDAIVMRALARTPVDRFDSAEEMQSAIEAFLAHQSEKYDARVLARTLEDLFGASQAQAKRSIAQTRSLSTNITRVMKRRTDGGGNLVEDSLLAAGSMPDDVVVAQEWPRTRLGPIVAGLLVLGLAVGAAFLVYGTNVFRNPPPPAAAAVTQASITIQSTPAGAAISIEGEPTGLKTPATLKGITTKRVSIRLELAGHTSVSQEIEVQAGMPLVKQFTLAPSESSDGN